MTERCKFSRKQYKLHDNQYFYFGCTCLPLYKRLYSHEIDSTRDLNRKLYKIFTYERFLNDDK